MTFSVSPFAPEAFPALPPIAGFSMATAEAGVVVVVASVLGSLGSLFVNGLWGFIVTIAILLIGWFVWAWLSAFIAQKVFNVTTTDTGEMLRTT